MTATAEALVTSAVSGPIEPCEGGCGAKVRTIRGASRPALVEATRAAIEHTADRCRALRAKLPEKEESRRVVRNFQRYSSEQRANHAASHRLGHRQRTAVGEAFYTHPDVPGVAFSSRGEAARAALARR